MGRHAKRSSQPPADGAGWVAGVFAPVGPFPVGRVLSAADALDELTRYLAHATHPGHGVARVAPDAYLLLGRLASASGRFVQVCEQVAAQLDTVAADPSLRADSVATGRTGGDPVWLAGRAAAATAAAAVAGRQLSGHLSAAQAATSRLYHEDTARDTDLPSGGGR